MKITDEAVEAGRKVYRDKVAEYQRDFMATEKSEGFWRNKYGTSLHATHLGEKWAMRAALEAALPHIKGEQEPVAWLRVETQYYPTVPGRREITLDPELGVMWAGHPNTVSVTPLYAHPSTELSDLRAENERLREFYEASSAIYEVGLLAASDEQHFRLDRARAALSEAKR